MKIGFIGVGHMAGSILKAISKNTEYEFYINDVNYNHADDISKVLHSSKYAQIFELIIECEQFQKSLLEDNLEEILI